MNDGNFGAQPPEHDNGAETPVTRRHRPRGSSLAGQMMMAAMLGLVDALGWERPPSAVVQIAGDLHSGTIDLLFGDLPPLD